MDHYLLPTYSSFQIDFVKGQGAWVWDSDSNVYLDALSGIAVTGLGHNHPKIMQAIREQTILHVSNLFQHKYQKDLSKLLAELACGEFYSFFSNSGAEANECAIKLARLYGHSTGVSTPKILVAEGGYHGRTLATLSASSNPTFKKNMSPFLEGFEFIPFNSIPALLEKVSDSSVVAVMLEPIQGEGGVNIPDSTYLQKVREICTANNWLYILDEVQTGIGRTGYLFAHQKANIVPDCITLAKGLANGLPIGATLVRAPFHLLFKIGSHGSTFGGNPFCTKIAITTLNTIIEENLLGNAFEQGQLLLESLNKQLALEYGLKAKGQGLMIGIEFKELRRDILKIGLLKENIIFNIARGKTLRLLPPLIISRNETYLIADRVARTIKEYTLNQVPINVI